MFKGAVGFVISYLVFMVPTYLLPYFGSNSAIVGAIGAAMGRGFTPMFWLHAWCLVMLVLVTSVRAKNIGKGWLLIFPVLASLFDLVPVLNLIPLVPTVMHLLALVLGAMGTAVVLNNAEHANTPVAKNFSWEPWAAGLMSLSAISGAFHFMNGMKATGKPVQALSAPVSIPPKAEPVKALISANATTQAQPVALASGTAAQSTQSTASTTVASQTASPVSAKPVAKKIPRPAEVRPVAEPRKVEDKPTVRYININN